MKVRVYNTIPAGLPPAEVVLKQREKNVDTSELSRVLKLVYAADNRTGLPAGELSVLASDSVPPEVAQWIRSQLLNPIVDNSVSSIVNNTQLDDDTILSLTRNVGESDREYIDRVDGLLRDWNKEEFKEDN